MFSVEKLIFEQLYLKMREENKKAALKITDITTAIRDFVKLNSKKFKDLAFDKYITASFQEKNKDRIKNLYAIKEMLAERGYTSKVVDSVPNINPTKESLPGLFLGKINLFDEETQQEKKISIYFSTQLGRATAFAYSEHDAIILCPDILVKINSEIYGVIYHEMIHITQPNKILPKRYIKSRVVSGHEGRLRLQDFYDYMRANIEFEATLAGVIETIKHNFAFLHSKAPNDVLWQRTRNIQLNNIKKLCELDRRSVLKEFSINYTEENEMPYENSIIPYDDLLLLQIIYYASLGDEKSLTGNVGRLRWNQLIKSFKDLYKELSESKNYATK